MRTVCKPGHPVPYSLHDMRVCKIQPVGDDLKFCFEYGYILLGEPSRQVDGDMLFEKADPEDCSVWLLSDNGRYGSFQGEKMTLTDFLKNYPDFTFEILDELYGYNMVSFTGYLSLDGRENLIEASFSIYYTGSIVYQLRN